MIMADIVQGKANPFKGIPKSSETCDISIVNTTSDIVAPTYYLIEPRIEGHQWINLPTFAFYIVHKASNKRVLFDLGSRKDWYNSVPHIAGMLSTILPGLKIEKDIVQVLHEGNVEVTDIDAVVLSHWHFDHCGDTSLFPKSTDLVVGPGFKDSFLPGFPSKESSPMPESAFEGRRVWEPPFSDQFKIGGFRAYDYFGDGSLYLLDVPGHAIGHMSAIVRTTPETAVLLGGDTCHFTGAIRPSEYIPMPENIPVETILDAQIPKDCPCLAFTKSHPNPNESRTVNKHSRRAQLTCSMFLPQDARDPLTILTQSPFYGVSTYKYSFYDDAKTSEQSQSYLAEFDADPNILILIAHDPTILDVCEFFPQTTINDWQQKGWKETMHWGFVNELPYHGKTVRKPLVDGLYKDGKKIKDLSETET